MIRLGIAIFATVALSACVSVHPLRDYKPVTVSIDAPTVGEVSTVEIGQTIISKGYLAKVATVTVEREVSENINWTGQSVIPPGSYQRTFENEMGHYYSVPNARFRVGSSEAPLRTAGIFVPSDKSKPAVIYHFPAAGNYGKDAVAIKLDEKEIAQQDSFKRELVYSGVAQGILNISYREFLNDLARPAYSQELKYDLAESKQFGYKGARFEVLKATNTELTYRVLKKLD